MTTPTLPIPQVMRALARAIEDHELPAIEKIAASRERHAFHVLIGTLLSARTQDATTHAASERLFRAAATPAAMSALTTRQVEKLIYPVSFYRNKARHVRATCRLLLERFGGSVPGTMADLLTLPGVGRKTAACVLLFAYDLPDIPVDTHVSRVGTRLGLFRPGAPFEELHDDLLAMTPAGQEHEIHINLLRHGRRVCHAQRPRCGECGLRRMCPGRREL